MASIIAPKRFTITMECDVVERQLVAISHVTSAVADPTRSVAVEWMNEDGSLTSYALGEVALKALEAHMPPEPQAPACPT